MIYYSKFKNFVLFLSFLLFLSSESQAIHDPQRLQSNDDRSQQVLATFFQPYEYTELIGKSKHSKVWGSPLHSYAIKVDHDLRTNQREFAMLSHAYNTLKQYDPQKTFRKRAAIVKPLHIYVQEKTQASLLVTERIYPLDKASQPLKLFLKIKYANIKDYVNALPPKSSCHTNMEQLCYDLGKLLAILQLGAKIDGNDFEFFLGRECQESNEYKIFLLDLEKSHDVSQKFKKKQMEKLVIAFSKALQEKKYAYFPPPSTEGFLHFRQGYLDFAARIDNENNENFCVPLAHKLFNHFIAHHPSKNL